MSVALRSAASRASGLGLGRLQDSNAVLSHFNDYSARSFAAVAGDLAGSARVLRSMKADLDHIFRRIRSLQERIQKHHPEALEQAACDGVADSRPDLETP
eukprot:SM000057S18403  [mRNA]  locus=s57:407607:408380:+ [translate_table: standard]